MINVRNVGLVASAVLAGMLASCGGGGGGDNSTPPAAATAVRSAALNQAQEVPTPPVASTATGRGAVVVNPTTKAITGGITFTGLTGTPSGAHIHRGNTNIAIALAIAGDNATATIPPNTTISDADYAELLAGTLYFNVHTASNPNGEIRGNITGTTGVTAGLATLNGANETPPNASTATGQATIVFDSATYDVLICYVTHDVANTTVAHIHTGAPGVSGPPNVVTLTQGTNVYYAPTTPSPVMLTTTNVTDMNAGNTYFNVHSAAFPNGEIRGQIAVQ